MWTVKHAVVVGGRLKDQMQHEEVAKDHNSIFERMRPFRRQITKQAASSWSFILTFEAVEIEESPCNQEHKCGPPVVLQSGLPYGYSRSGPQIWEITIILPLKKVGKPSGCIFSYRPVSLASGVAKMLENPPQQTIIPGGNPGLAVHRTCRIP